MCEYYAHTFQCKHQTLSFAKFCKPANLIQTPCARKGVWASIDMPGPCEECWMWFPDRVYATAQKIKKPRAGLHNGARAK